MPDGAVLTLEDGASRHSAGGSSVLLLGTAHAADRGGAAAAAAAGGGGGGGAGCCRLLTASATHDADGSHISSSSPSSGAASSQAQAQAQAQAPSELLNPLDCYICKKPFIKLHFFYASLCPDCASFNYSKRSEKADMRGRVVLVTGARQKIG